MVGTFQKLYGNGYDIGVIDLDDNAYLARRIILEEPKWIHIDKNVHKIKPDGENYSYITKEGWGILYWHGKKYEIDLKI